MRYCVLDLETGGKDPGYHEMLELTLVEINPTTLQEVSRYTTGVKPVHPARITEEALETNKLKLKDILKYPTPVQVRGAFNNYHQEALGGEPLFLIGHNIGFDIGFLKQFFQYQYEDIFHYASLDSKGILEGLKLFALIDQEESTRLEDLTLKLDIPHNPHSSYEDCYAVIFLLRALKENISFENIFK